MKENIHCPYNCDWAETYGTRARSEASAASLNILKTVRGRFTEGPTDNSL